MRTCLSAYFRFNKMISNICLFIAVCGVAFAVFALTLAAIERHFFGFGYALLNDFPPLVMPWVVFPMMSVLLRGDQHITVDFLPHMLPLRLRLFLGFAVGFIVFVASIWLMFGGIDALGFFIGLNQRTETGIKFPLWWIYLSFPVGFGLLAWFALEKMVAAVTEMITGRPVAMQGNSA